jgi:glyoxylase-like metal-dependent hydrolase (beta-lactamase superfamily II)/rhodanese-related sulfurtransferase
MEAGVQVEVLETPELGDRSYVIADHLEAAVIDPQRDLDRLLGLIDRRGWRVRLVLETHLHNDYVTGGLELSRRTGATYVVAGGEEATFDCCPAREQDGWMVGRCRIKVVSTPGHTPGHCAYLLQGAGSEDLAVFSGGSMLFGTVGRTDLVAPERTDELSRLQHRSVRRLAFELPESVEVHPTHGFGSFCASSPGSGGQRSWVGEERRTNLACRIEDEEEFVRTLRAGLGAYPSYYAHMGLLNRAGPAALDLTPPPRVTPQDVPSRIAAGEWVVDLRPRRQYARSHLPGTVGVELDPSYFTTYLGWVVPWGTPITLAANSEAELARAQRDLARIGIDRPAAAVLLPEDLGDAGRGYRVAGWEELAAELNSPRPPVILDVRSEEEWRARHLPSATWVPLGELGSRLGELPRVPTWVHCQAGYRASVAASLLDRAGITPVLVDDDFGGAAASGLALVVEVAPSGSGPD